MTAPSAHYRRHHDVEPPRIDATAFRQGWRVRSRLDGLLAARRISATVWIAGTQYRDCVEIMRRSSIASSGVTRVHGNGGGAGLVTGTLHAAARVRAIDAAMQPFGTRLVMMCVVEDNPWYVTARCLGVRDVTARAWTVIALNTLASLWGVSDRAYGRIARNEKKG